MYNKAKMYNSKLQKKAKDQITHQFKMAISSRQIQMSHDVWLSKKVVQILK